MGITPVAIPLSTPRCPYQPLGCPKEAALKALPVLSLPLCLPSRPCPPALRSCSTKSLAGPRRALPICSPWLTGLTETLRNQLHIACSMWGTVGLEVFPGA